MKHSEHKMKFAYNRKKAIQVLLWFLNKHGGQLNRLKLVKLIFFADREHLAKYGRPIVGGVYYTLKHGPVCSELLTDIQNSDSDATLPFQNQNDSYDVSSTGDHINEDFLSESDIEILEAIEQKYGHYDRFKLRDLTHELKAYKQNDPEAKGVGRLPLSYEDFFLDLDDTSILELIYDNQEAWAGLE